MAQRVAMPGAATGIAPAPSTGALRARPRPAEPRPWRPAAARAPLASGAAQPGLAAAGRPATPAPMGFANGAAAMCLCLAAAVGARRAARQGAAARRGAARRLGLAGAAPRARGVGVAAVPVERGLVAADFGAERKVAVKASSVVRRLFTAAKKSAFSQNVWYESPDGGTKNGPKSVWDYWQLRPTREIERIDDGIGSCGCTWKQLDGKRGVSYIRVDKEGRVAYMREILEPLEIFKFTENNMKSLSPAFGVMDKIAGFFNTFDNVLVVEDKDKQRPRPYRGLAQPKTRAARDVVQYLWQEAQFSMAPLDPVERCVEEYAENAVYEDLTYKEEVWPASKEALRKWQQETLDAAPGNLVFVPDEFTDGQRSCTVTWHVEYNGQTSPRGVSFYELDAEGKVEYVRMGYRLDW